MAERIGRTWNIPGIGVGLLGQDTIYSLTITIRGSDIAELDKMCQRNQIVVKRDDKGHMVPVDANTIDRPMSAKMRRAMRKPKDAKVYTHYVSYFLKGTSGAVRVVNDWAYGRAKIEWNTSAKVPNGMQNVTKKCYASSVKDNVVVTKEFRAGYRRPVASSSNAHGIVWTGQTKNPFGEFFSGSHHYYAQSVDC